jgi:hypothetical protein
MLAWPGVLVPQMALLLFSTQRNWNTGIVSLEQDGFVSFSWSSVDVPVPIPVCDLI